jgi:hypothetical protein
MLGISYNLWATQHVTAIFINPGHVTFPKKKELKTLLSCISCNSQPIAMIPFVNLDFWSFWRCLGCQINVNTAAFYYVIFLVIFNSLQLVQSIRHVRYLVFVPETFQICILRCKDIHNDLKCRCTVGFG